MKEKPLAIALRVILDGWAHEWRLKRMQKVIREGMEKMRIEQIEAAARDKAQAAD